MICVRQTLDVCSFTAHMYFGPWKTWSGKYTAKLTYLLPFPRLLVRWVGGRWDWPWWKVVNNGERNMYAISMPGFWGGSAVCVVWRLMRDKSGWLCSTHQQYHLRFMIHFIVQYSLMIIVGRQLSSWTSGSTELGWFMWWRSRWRSFNSWCWCWRWYWHWHSICCKVAHPEMAALVLSPYKLRLSKKKQKAKAKASVFVTALNQSQSITIIMSGSLRSFRTIIIGYIVASPSHLQCKGVFPFVW